MFTNIKKLRGFAPIAAATTVVYTAPVAVGSQTQITRIKLHNTHSVAVDVALFDNGSATAQRAYAVTIAAGDTLEVADEWQLEAGQTIQAGASVDAVVNMAIAGREYTP